jgi:hypothetical protein
MSGKPIIGQKVTVASGTSVIIKTGEEQERITLDENFIGIVVETLPFDRVILKSPFEVIVGEFRVITPTSKLI